MGKFAKSYLYLSWFLVLQFMLMPGHYANLAKEPYRQQERLEALKAYTDNPSPITKAAFEDEQRRVSEHVSHRLGDI